MYKLIFKRLLDIIVSLLVMPFVLMIIIVFGIAIKLEDHGPIFYNAERRGKNGKVFRMYKLRSMHVNSPDIRNKDGSTYNSESDQRITKIGKIMRKTSVDEFPQFINVLIGDMSIIGPRPILAVQPYDELSSLAKERLEIKPGITGYSQAYFRNSIIEDEKFVNDIYYKNHVSFVLDCKILLKTVVSVLRKENIYIK